MRECARLALILCVRVCMYVCVSQRRADIGKHWDSTTESLVSLESIDAHCSSSREALQRALSRAISEKAAVIVREFVTLFFNHCLVLLAAEPPMRLVFSERGPYDPKQHAVTSSQDPSVARKVDVRSQVWASFPGLMQVGWVSCRH